MKKIIRILNLDIHSLNNAEYKNFMERFFKLIPLKAVSGEGDRPSELRLLGEEENMTSDFVGISDEDKATFNADMLLLTDVVNQSRTNDNTALLLNLDKRRDPLVSFIINTTSIGRKSSNPAYAQACISLYNILKPYRGIQKHSDATGNRTDQRHALRSRQTGKQTEDNASASRRHRLRVAQRK
ncbi:MAG: DUF6261 family protein [Parabacteroides merdae]